jgi:hypothetical protein
MKLVEAREVLNESPRPESPVLEIPLACDFTPLHFLTFLNAHLRREFPEHKIAAHLIADQVSESQVDLPISNQATRYGFARSAALAFSPLPQIIFWRPQENSAQPYKPGEERSEYI